MATHPIPSPPTCAACNSNRAPAESSKVSSEGWVIFFALLLFCFPLSLIGLLVRDRIKVCADCGMELP